MFDAQTERFLNPWTIAKDDLVRAHTREYLARVNYIQFTNSARVLRASGFIQDAERNELEAARIKAWLDTPEADRR